MTNEFRVLVARAALFLGLASSAAAMTVLPPSFDELVAESGRIVRGRVVAAEPFKALAPDGRELIKTRVTWEIDRTLKGEPARTLTLEFLGGRIGEKAMRVAGMPEFKCGNDDFLFVEPGAASFCPLVAAGHGRYRVKTDSSTGRAFVARQNGRALTDTSEVARPLSAESLSPTTPGLSPDSFAEAITFSLLKKPEVVRVR